MNNTEPEQNMGIPKQWYVDAFGPLYPLLYAHRTVTAAASEVRFACGAVSLTGDDAVLDLCCGAGRHLTALEGVARCLVGVDYSPGLLALAGQQVGKNVGLVRADMRRLPFNARFDVVFSFFTSFGYFLDDRENFRAACELARVLKKGGRFFMDYLNPLSIEETLKPETVRIVDKFTVRERRWVDREAHRVNKRVEVRQDNEAVATTFESVRLYTFEEMKAIFLQAGLALSDCRGDYSGASYEKDSPRMILTGFRESS